jgi:hypothetical protein
MPMTAPSSPPDDPYEIYRAEWRRTDDPRWIWRVIKTCIREQEPFPEWCLDYLDQVATGLEKIRRDIGRELPMVLGFSAKRGPRLSKERALRREIFIVEFMRQVLRGVDAQKARAAAAATIKGYPKDREELSKQVREFFELEELPSKRLEWWQIIGNFLATRPWFFERYPDLRELFDFRSKSLS